MAVDHLSLYQLTIEPGTRFGDLAARGRLRGLPDAGPAADMFVATQEICGAAGLAGLRDLEPRPARRREPAQPRLLALRRLCRHRPGRARPADASAACAGRPRRSARRRPGSRRSRPAAARRSRTPVAPDEQAVEMLMMGLRLAEGVDLGRYAALAGRRCPTTRSPSSPSSASSTATATGCGVTAGRAAGARRGAAAAARLARQQLAEAVELLERRVADAQLARLLARAGARC